MRILVLGGYGNFGARVCRALARSDVEVIAAGRDPDRGHREASLDAQIKKACVDISGPRFLEQLRELSPGIVIHCVGPYQDQDYRVALASLSVGAHYIDLADGRSFVSEFSRALHSIATEKRLLAISGASTLPALSSAVIDSLRSNFASIQEIQISIAPAQRAPRGAATVKAVFSYLGKPFKWWKDGAWQNAYGWQELRCLRFDGLGRRWAAACDVPDLQLFPEHYPEVQTVQFRAALELGIQHFFLAAVAQLIRVGIPIPLQNWAVPLDRMASWLNRFGSECGGMLVSAVGTKKDGSRSRMTWHLTADNNHGPEIPCMATILLARKLTRGDITLRGAMPCVSLLTLDEFIPEFARWGIRTKIEETAL